MADMIGLLCPKKDLAQLCTLDECSCSECMTFTAGGGIVDYRLFARTFHSQGRTAQ